MPREKSFDPDVVLERAVELFWRSGYDGTSMTKLLEVMHISRQSLYDTFGDKHSLFLSALDRYRTNVHGGLAAQLDGPASALEGVRAAFQWVREAVIGQSEYRSCFMANSALELGQRDPEVRTRVGAHLCDIEELFFTTLERAREGGELGETRDTRALARFLTSSIHGLGIMARGGASEQAVEDALKVSLSVLAPA